MRLFPIVMLALLATAAAPADTALRDRIVAEARLVPPTMLAFDRTTVATQTGGGEKASETRVDRWDGKSWSAVSANGKPPSTDQAAKARKAFAAYPVPGYYRLASLLASAALATDGRGRTVLRGAAPAGSVFTNGKDVSGHFSAEAVIAPGPRPYVEQLRLAAFEPFRLMLVAKIETFVSVSDYRPDASGHPRLVRQVVDADGAMLGRAGVQHTELSFAYR